MSMFLSGCLGSAGLGLGVGSVLGAPGWRPWLFRGLLLLTLLPWLIHHTYLFDALGLFVLLAPGRALALPGLFWAGLGAVAALCIPALVWPRRLRLPAVLLPAAAGASTLYLVLPACWARGLELYRCAPHGPPLLDNVSRVWLAWLLAGGSALLAGYVVSAHVRGRSDARRTGATASTRSYEG